MAAKKKTKAAPKAKADGLLGRILADPTDLESRLIYGDQAMEANDPRGTFIAHQCALADLDPLDPRYAPMLASTRRLQAAHGFTWLAGFPKETKLEPEHCVRTGVDGQFNAVFENGFLHRIAMVEEDIEKLWPRLSEREPIAGIELIVGEGLDAPYHHLKAPKAFRVLKVSPESWFTANSVANILAWGMPQLRQLDLSRCDIGATGCELIANRKTDLGTHFPDHVDPPPFADGQLTHLALKNCGIGDSGAEILFAARHLASLEALDVAQCRIALAATLVALRKAPAMKALKRLTISGNNTLAEHLHVLAGWEALPQLVQLAPPQTTPLTALQALFPKPSAHLRELDLSSAKDLLKTPGAVLDRAEALSSLDIGSTSLGDDGWSVLVAAPSMKRAVHLFANGCSLSDDAIRVLTGSKLRSLVTLDLSSNKLTDAGLALLAEWPGLEHVTHLRIGNNRKVTTAGFQSFIDASAFHPAVFDIGKSTDRTLKSRLGERFGDAVVSK